MSENIKELFPEYMQNKIGEEYLIPCYFTAKKLTKKLFKTMPNSCVIKTRSGSGTIHIIRDKQNESYNYLKKELTDWLSIEHGYIDGELWYNEIPKGIVCEQLLLDSNGDVPKDYKFHVFNNNGNSKVFVQVDCDRFTNHTRNVYDEDFNRIEMTMGYPNFDGPFDKPKNIKKMVKQKNLLL